MNLENLGEFDLIDRIKKCVTNSSKCVIIGIGDDAAVIDPGHGDLLLMTSDALVEGVHFKREHATFRQIGWRAMTANLSDIAAMGGKPQYATVSLCLSKSPSLEEVDELYGGMGAIALQFGCVIVGGDITSSPDGTIISIAMLGTVEKDRLALRRGAKVGDVICVTGDLGGSKAGLEVLKTGELSSAEYAVKRHLEPRPRVAEARAIGDVARVHAMIDISDGLSSEVNHICRESRVGARIFTAQIPVHESTGRIARRFSSSAIEYALSGGEDLELLFTILPSDVDPVKSSVKEKTGTEVSVIGEILESAQGISIVSEDGREHAMLSSGYQHFSNGSGRYRAVGSRE